MGVLARLNGIGCVPCSDGEGIQNVFSRSDDLTILQAREPHPVGEVGREAGKIEARYAQGYDYVTTRTETVRCGGFFDAVDRWKLSGMDLMLDLMYYGCENRAKSICPQGSWLLDVFISSRAKRGIYARLVRYSKSNERH